MQTVEDEDDAFEVDVEEFEVRVSTRDACLV